MPKPASLPDDPAIPFRPLLGALTLSLLVVIKKEESPMKPYSYYPLFLLSLSFLLPGCSAEMAEKLGLVMAKDLVGEYRGILQGFTVTDLDNPDSKGGRLMVDIGLLHKVTVHEVETFAVSIESEFVPRFRAYVFGAAAAAINLEFVEFENFDPFKDKEPTGISIKQVIFVNFGGEWIVTFQVSRVGFTRDQYGWEADGVNFYQYVSYPASVADQMSKDDAIKYVDMILDLASHTQRR